eukprot:TRINITY_DN1486_c0_g2_i1.p1 TRINITY_DN1486_c0_g2~~TRINITY_DN1486_c0_g2_i1.p1  ORF type:complete len:126 (+),score=22.89 TRINITY_DN1486_c0_g2_i1:43-420(+)
MKTLLILFIAFVALSLVVSKTSAKVEDHQIANQAANLGRKVDGGIKVHSVFATNNLAETMAESNPYGDSDSIPGSTHTLGYKDVKPPEKKTNSLAATMAESNPYANSDSVPDTTHILGYKDIKHP